MSLARRKQMKSAVNSFSSLSSSPALECAGWLMIKTNIPRRDVTSQILVTLILQIGLFPSGKEQSGLPLGNNVFAVGVAERAEGFKTSCRIDGLE